LIGPSSGVRVPIALKPVDFRKGASGLAALVQAEIKADPFSGTAFVFRAKRADRVKLVFWDGTGLCLFVKTLEDGRFRWPKIEDGSIRLTPAQLGALIEGLDWMRVHAEDMAPEKYGRSTRPSVMIHDRLGSKYALIPSRV
jgi:transposase